VFNGSVGSLVGDRALQAKVVPALKSYRENLGLDETWTLLRGDESSVQELAMLRC
jgi:hypothetical protein